ncbi:ABC transporter permease [Desulfovermiculus halophilus]|uniref:ABC transporter permease n=1 Tax=Desulfovermiculus halophilus TaxID=339722 RepID=UPI0004862775|nr:ABC transporter permease [Desulfovermiculus halophilus]
MSAFTSTWNKEFKDYFVSPIAYMVIAIFLLVTGWFFFSTFFIQDQASLRSFFNLLPITFAFVIPALTMRLFAEEFNVGSYEILSTMPISPVQIILSKFLAAVCMVGAMLLPTLAYVGFVAWLGDLDPGPVLGGYVGSLLLGASFAAIGLFTSALTRNQIIAYILGALCCFVLTLMNQMLFFVPSGIMDLIQYLAVSYHFQNIAKGVIDTRDVLYFASVIAIGLYLTTLAIHARE